MKEETSWDLRDMINQGDANLEKNQRNNEIKGLLIEEFSNSVSFCDQGKGTSHWLSHHQLRQKTIIFKEIFTIKTTATTYIFLAFNFHSTKLVRNEITCDIGIAFSRMVWLRREIKTKHIIASWWLEQSAYFRL